MYNKYSQHLAFTLRFCVAISLTWCCSLYLDSQSIATSLSTTAVIMATGERGASIKKSLARLLGTCLGGLFVLYVASHFLIDAWLYNLILIIGIVMSVGIASAYRDDYAYIFSITGLTISLVGIPLANHPDIFHVFDSVQSRCIAIALGIIFAQVASLIVPYHIKPPTIKFDKEKIIKLAYQNLIYGLNEKAFIKKGITYINSKKSIHNNYLFLNYNENNHQYDIDLAYLYDLLFKVDELKVISKQLNINDLQWKQFLFSNVKMDHEKILQIFHLQQNDVSSIFIQKAIDLKKFIVGIDESQLVLSKEAELDTENLFINMLRSFCVLFFISYIWLSLQWDSGIYAMSTAGLVLSIYAGVPKGYKFLPTKIWAQTGASVLALIFNFAIMPMQSFFLFFISYLMIIVIFSFVLSTNTGKVKMFAMYILFVLPTLLPMNNMASYDLENFLNLVIAKIFSLFIMAGFYILLPVPDKKKVLIKRINKKIMSAAKLSHNYSVKNEVVSLIALADFILDQKTLSHLLYMGSLNNLKRQQRLNLFEQKMVDKANKNSLTNDDKNEISIELRSNTISYNSFYLLTRLIALK